MATGSDLRCHHLSSDSVDWAAKEGAEHLFKLLLVHGADPHSVDISGIPVLSWTAAGWPADETPLYRATREGHTDMGTQTLLNFAADQKHHDIVALLLKHGADVNGRNESGETALAVALDNGDNKMGQFLLSRSADPNLTDSKGTAPLLVAVRNNRFKHIALLLEHGADPNVRDNCGTPVIVEASHWDDAKLTKLLISHGADPKAKDENGMTMADYAAI
ncbi:hypothetical protein FE257_011232 [Aspergillus nanangensis]|uniref:Uncharacterized protein n=1 Tax=Aspergillus nanangensis TaxID=2582783 RepID=A0AAD4CJ78_ASPNN|nr:hypothetical protein FE257_011232 [Aspergillus nanangensis]